MLRDRPIKATRRIQFCAGHRVHGHESKCSNLHGHNYVAFFTATPLDGLDELGRVIDFGVLKEKLGGWVDRNWDHGFIIGDDDDKALTALARMGPDQKLFVLPANPTAENMARYLVQVVGPAELEGTGVCLEKVVLWETENCYAESSI